MMNITSEVSKSKARRARDNLHAYSIYGLSVSADIALPELISHAPAQRPDVTIRGGEVAEQVPDAERDVYYRRATTDAALFHYPLVGTFLVEDGSRVTYEPQPDVEEQTLRQFLVSICLGVAMHQRGHLVLHASALKVGTGVVAFVGEKGQGKSTMAAAMVNAGYSLVADDVVPLTHDQPHVLPGLRQLKLWPEALEATLCEKAAPLPRVNSRVEKRIKALETREEHNQLPLRAIYVLTGGEEVAVSSLPKQSRFTALVQHSYMRNLLQDTGTAARNLKQCTTLAQRVPVFQLARPRELSALPTVVEAVARHATTLSGSES